MSTSNDNENETWETIIDFENENSYQQDDDNVNDDGDHDDDDNRFDYSLDYEFPGPRFANYRSIDPHDVSDDASVLSDIESDQSAPRFDMWDDDPYNDFTWESNDMQLTRFIKQKQRQLKRENKDNASFWKQEKGWPKQLPFSCSSSNHDQSANAICLVQSNYGLSEYLYAVYRDRIIECGKPPATCRSTKAAAAFKSSNHTTLLESSSHPQSANASHAADKFMDTHQSISLSTIPLQQYEETLDQPTPSQQEHLVAFSSEALISQFKPYTKFLKRSDYPGTLPEDSYLYLGFDPQCLAQKYGYMAIGGVEGEFELYCCMNPENPVKIWGTKFKGKDNVMLMTNAIQIIRFKNNVTGSYQHMLIGCMNEAGLLFYHLPAHNRCEDIRTLRQHAAPMVVQLHSHLRSFNGMPINDAKLSPDGNKLVCVGDDRMVFLIDVHHCPSSGEITFGAPFEIVIPPTLFPEGDASYTSQYVAWSPSSRYFAHTSDSHNLILVWRASTRELLYAIDAAGYTYAITFHPQLDNILVFTNRYGYFHTVDFAKGTTDTASEFIDILSFDRQTHSSRGHQCLDSCLSSQHDHAVFRTRHLKIQHEITMVSFRGEIDKRLRILAKINGIEWSKDGKYLFVATKKRVLAFQFSYTQPSAPTLIDFSSLHIRKSLENQQELKLGKKTRLDKDDVERLSDWDLLPDHVHNRILGDTQLLACHW
ncbi:hypothetical protein [Parasitella parasitica]|uniref:Uncharacterized protein n=1 Tax=Parasitella parasitica TaxID=35722 RepID=A0A0B7NE83_9FUNG|nr:hypothetical protein [Parasitella parasitica]